MNTIAKDIYQEINTLIDLDVLNAYTVVNSRYYNGMQKHENTAVIYKKNDIIVDNGMFKHRKYHNMTLGGLMVPDVPRYAYLSDEFFKEVEKGEKYFTDIDWKKYDITYDLTIGKIKNPNIKNIVYPENSSHLFKRYEDNYPISSMYIFDNISSFNDLEFNLDTLYGYLKNHDYVKKIKRVKLPYYIASPGKTEALELNIYLPQDVHDRLWKKVEKNEFASCSIKEMIQGRWIYKHIDPLGISSFKCTEKEILEKENKDNF